MIFCVDMTSTWRASPAISARWRSFTCAPAVCSTADPQGIFKVRAAFVACLSRINFCLLYDLSLLALKLFIKGLRGKMKVPATLLVHSQYPKYLYTNTLTHTPHTHTQ